MGKQTFKQMSMLITIDVQVKLGYMMKFLMNEGITSVDFYRILQTQYSDSDETLSCKKHLNGTKEVLKKAVDP